MVKEQHKANYNTLQSHCKAIFIFPCLIFVSILISQSCTNPYKNLTKTEYPATEINQIPYGISNYEKTLIYKTDISFYKNEIGGLLIIKKTDPGIYRIALTTQFGLKIFDFELNNGVLNVQYCVEYLNKKYILSTFQSDFNLILMQNKIEKIVFIENPIQGQNIWQLKSGKLNFDYVQNTESEKVENIIYKKGNNEKISVGLCSFMGNIPKNITLEHRNIKLKMNLKLIQ